MFLNVWLSCCRWWVGSCNFKISGIITQLTDTSHLRLLVQIESRTVSIIKLEAHVPVTVPPDGWGRSLHWPGFQTTPFSSSPIPSPGPTPPAWTPKELTHFWTTLLNHMTLNYILAMLKRAIKKRFGTDSMEPLYGLIITVLATWESWETHNTFELNKAFM